MRGLLSVCLVGALFSVAHADVVMPPPDCPIAGTVPGSTAGQSHGSRQFCAPSLCPPDGCGDGFECVERAFLIEAVESTERPRADRGAVGALGSPVQRYAKVVQRCDDPDESPYEYDGVEGMILFGTSVQAAGGEGCRAMRVCAPAGTNAEPTPEPEAPEPEVETRAGGVVVPGASIGAPGAETTRTPPTAEVEGCAGCASTRPTGGLFWVFAALLWAVRRR